MARNAQFDYENIMNNYKEQVNILERELKET